MFVGTDAAVRDWKNKGKLRASKHRRNYKRPPEAERKNLGHNITKLC